MNRIIKVSIVVAASSLILSQSLLGGGASAIASQKPPLAKAAKNAISPPEEPSNIIRWEIKSSADLTGAKGRLVVDFHDEVPMAHMLVQITSKDGRAPISDRKR